jgi:hypothetical protein
VAWTLIIIYMQDIKMFKGSKQPAATSTTVHTAVEQGSKYVPPPSRDHSLLTESPSLISVSISMMYFAPLALLGAYFAWRYYSGSA